MKFKNVENTDGTHYGVTFKCPGCAMSHTLPNQNSRPDYVGPRWTFNGDYAKPTLSPSISARGAMKLDEPDETKDWDADAICHSFVTDGRIQFLGDCTHALAGQTVDLPDVA